MRNIFLLLSVNTFYFLVSCKKESIQLSNTENHIVQIVGDSIGAWSYTYTNNRISDLYEQDIYGNNSIYHYAIFQYPSDNIVKVSLASDTTIYVQYYLTNSKLPLLIERHEGTGIESFIKFYYNDQTHLLDSAVDVYSFGSDWTHTNYLFEFENFNIVKLIRTQSTSSWQNSYTDTFSYTYDESLNAFQKSNALLSIYSNPFAELGETFNMVVYFPQIFSANTLTSYTFPLNAPLISGQPRTILINNATTNDGKILTTQSWIWNRQYFYQ